MHQKLLIPTSTMWTDANSRAIWHSIKITHRSYLWKCTHYSHWYWLALLLTSIHCLLLDSLLRISSISSFSPLYIPEVIFQNKSRLLHIWKIHFKVSRVRILSGDDWNVLKFLFFDFGATLSDACSGITPGRARGNILHRCQELKPGQSSARQASNLLTLQPIIS